MNTKFDPSGFTKLGNPKDDSEKSEYRIVFHCCFCESFAVFRFDIRKSVKCIFSMLVVC